MYGSNGDLFGKLRIITVTVIFDGIDLQNDI